MECLGEQKIEVGDHIRSTPNFGALIFKVTEILENRDSRVEKPFDGTNAYFKCKVERVD